jgi:hypothetical protein
MGMKPLTGKAVEINIEIKVLRIESNDVLVRCALVEVKSTRVRQSWQQWLVKGDVFKISNATQDLPSV